MVCITYILGIIWVPMASKTHELYILFTLQFNSIRDKLWLQSKATKIIILNSIVVEKTMS
jgi:hypothetical protein